MIDIPPEVQLRATLRSGSVQFFTEETHLHPKPHFFAVLNRGPLADSDLVLIHATSEVEKARRRTSRRPETLVVLAPADYPEFTAELSAFDGNTAYSRTVRELIAMVNRGQLEFRSWMPEEVVERLRQAVLASPAVGRGLKKLLLDPEARDSLNY